MDEAEPTTAPPGLGLPVRPRYGPAPVVVPDTICGRCGGIVVNRGGHEQCASWVCVLRAWPVTKQVDE